MLQLDDAVEGCKGTECVRGKQRRGWVQMC